MRALAGKPHDAIVKFAMYQNAQWHHAVLDPCDSPASCFHVLYQACKRLTTRCYNIIIKSSVGTLDKSDVLIKICLSLKLTLDVGVFIILLVAKFRLGQSNSFSLRAKVPQLFCSRERKFYGVTSHTATYLINTHLQLIS